MSLSSLTALVKAQVRATAKKALDESTPSDELNYDDKLTFKHDEDAGLKGDEIWHDKRTLAASGSDTLDLAGSLTNAFGETITFAKVRAILIHNTSDDQDTPTDAQIQVGGATNEFQGPFGAAGDLLNVEAGGFFMVTNPTSAGWAVTAGTADELQIANQDGTDQAEYVIVIVGEAA